MTTLSNEERARIFMKCGFFLVEVNEEQESIADHTEMPMSEIIRDYSLKTIMDAARPHINEEAFIFNDSEFEYEIDDDLEKLTTDTLRILALAMKPRQ